MAAPCFREFAHGSFLVGAQRVGGAGIFGRITAKKDRGALSFVIAEIGAVLGVARKLGQLRRELSRYFRRIGEPVVLVGLSQPRL